MVPVSRHSASSAVVDGSTARAAGAGRRLDSDAPRRRGLEEGRR